MIGENLEFFFFKKMEKNAIILKNWTKLEMAQRTQKYFQFGASFSGFLGQNVLDDRDSCYIFRCECCLPFPE